jgi:hypothetical protein
MSEIGKFSVLYGKGKPNLNQNYIVTMADMTYPALRAKKYMGLDPASPELCLIYLELDTSQRQSHALQKVKTREY